MFSPVISTKAVTVYNGNFLNVLKQLPDNSVHAIVTDPPYGLNAMPPDMINAAISAWVSGNREHVPDGKGHMGHEWDRFVPPPAVWDECLRVLKPGGFLAAFAGSRTVDLMGLSLRLAGFEVRDTLAYIYKSGMPKSMDVSRAIDKAAGAERTVKRGVKPGHEEFVGRDHLGALRDNGVFADKGGFSRPWMHDKQKIEDAHWDFEPVTDAAKRWDGYGTSLKPAVEPIVLCRKPLQEKTVANNLIEHGVGALNIEVSRIGTSGGSTQPSGFNRVNKRNAEEGFRPGAYQKRTPAPPPEKGRYPSNVIVGEEVADRIEDAEKFFCCPKAPTKERPEYIDSDGKKIRHPTVKSLELMKWVTSLVCPDGGVVLDPFAGSGSTLEAAVTGGFTAIGIEQHEPYIPLIQQRVDRAVAPTVS